MFTNYDVRRKKLSFSYNVPYRFPKNSELAIGERALLQQRSKLLVKYLNGQCAYDAIEDIDKKINHQRDVNNHSSISSNCYLFSKPTLVNYDVDFLEMFADAYLNFDAYNFFRYVPIFEIENVKICAYMPEVDKFGNVQTGEDGKYDVVVTIEIVVITVNMSIEDFKTCAQKVFNEIRLFGKKIYNCEIDDLGEVRGQCEIIEKIDEGQNETRVYGYKDATKSSAVKRDILLEVVKNPELARRLYCGKVWTDDALKFTKNYYKE